MDWRHVLVWILLASCSDGSGPDDLVEAELSVAFSEGKADYARGTALSATTYVSINGVTYQLVTKPSAKVIGFEGESYLSMSGRTVRLVGGVDGHFFNASYVELMPQDASVMLRREAALYEEQVAKISRNIELNERSIQDLRNEPDSDQKRAKLEQSQMGLAADRAYLEEMNSELEKIYSELESLENGKELAD